MTANDRSSEAGPEGDSALERAESAALDRQLIRQIARGDRQALAELYDRHAPALARLGRRFFKAQDTAEDVLHDVFLEAWKRAGDYDPERGSVAAWLAIRMRSRCLDRLRRDNKRVLSGDPTTARGQTQQRPDASATPLELGGDGNRARIALDSLNDGEKSVVEALFFSDLSSSEAATSLGIPIGTVKSRVRSAMEKLRRTLRVEVR